MYSIKIIMKHSVSEKQKEILKKIVQEADKHAECQADGTLLEIRSDDENDELDRLSYLLGVAVGGSSANEIVSLCLQYDKGLLE